MIFFFFIHIFIHLALINVKASSYSKNPPGTILKNAMFAPFPTSNLSYSQGLFATNTTDMFPWIMVDLGVARIISALHFAYV